MSFTFPAVWAPIIWARGRGTSEDLGGGVRRASGNPYPISDLTQNLTPYFRPDPNPISFASAFEKGFKFPTLVKRQFLEKKINKRKNHTRSHIRVHKPHPISDQDGQNLYPISDQKGSKTMPFGAADTYIAYLREYLPGRWEAIKTYWDVTLMSNTKMSSRFRF